MRLANRWEPQKKRTFNGSVCTLGDTSGANSFSIPLDKVKASVLLKKIGPVAINSAEIDICPDVRTIFFEKSTLPVASGSARLSILKRVR